MFIKDTYTEDRTFPSHFLKNTSEAELVEELFAKGFLTIIAQMKSLEKVIGVSDDISKPEGRMDCAMVIQKGNILGMTPKTYISNYSEFYEKSMIFEDTADKEISFANANTEEI